MPKIINNYRMWAYALIATGFINWSYQRDQSDVVTNSAFVVIPACAGRLLSRRFPVYVVSSALLGGGCALVGLLGSGLTNLPSGPCVVMVQFLGFVVALVISQSTRRSPAVAGPGGRQILGGGPAAPEPH